MASRACMTKRVDETNIRTVTFTAIIMLPSTENVTHHIKYLRILLFTSNNNKISYISDRLLYILCPLFYDASFTLFFILSYLLLLISYNRILKLIIIRYDLNKYYYET